jgi:peptidoglycan/LPS O-acetylase OafA/YrhL
MPSLDGLRGLAILLVLAHQFDPSRDATGGVAHVVHLALNLGWSGVQLFFVLSGFLITGILLEARASPRYYRAFFGRRVLRIFPLYYLALFVAFVIAPALGGPPTRAQEQLVFWAYCVNWTQPFGVGAALLPHFWSLAVEEQFYLAWPFVVRRLAPAAVARLAIALAILAVLARVAVRLAALPDEAAYTWTVCRMDALALGALLAAAARDADLSPRLARRGPAIIALAILVGLAGLGVTRGYPRTTALGQTLGYTALAVAFAGLVLAAVLADVRGTGPLRAALTFAPLRAVGRVSYGMYVIHFPLQTWVLGPLVARALAPIDPSGPAFAIASVGFASTVTFAVAWLVFELFERRFLAYKARFVA